MNWQDIIIWVLVIVSMITVFWYVLGNSPTMEQSILILAMTLLFTISAKTTRNEEQIKILNKQFDRMEKGFINMARDFKDFLKGHK